MHTNGVTHFSVLDFHTKRQASGATADSTVAAVEGSACDPHVGTRHPSPEESAYRFLRGAIGLIGIALPFVLVIGLIICRGPEFRTSLSAYYYGPMGSVFVGSLCAIAIFLLSYRDYRSETIADDIASTLGGLFLLGVALFPTPRTAHGNYPWVGRLHFTFAALFFITMAYFCFCQFTKSSADKHDRPLRKALRNTIYVSCGAVILGCIVLLGLNAVFVEGSYWGKGLQNLRVVTVLESIAIVAFGFSWLVKGGLVFADKPEAYIAREREATVTGRPQMGAE